MRKRKVTMPEARVDMAMLGPDWLGLIYFRIYAAPDAWITFGGLKLLWFNVVFKLPAFVQRALGSDKRAEW